MHPFNLEVPEIYGCPVASLHALVWTSEKAFVFVMFWFCDHCFSWGENNFNDLKNMKIALFADRTLAISAVTTEESLLTSTQNVDRLRSWTRRRHRFLLPDVEQNLEKLSDKWMKVGNGSFPKLDVRMSLRFLIPLFWYLYGQYCITILVLKKWIIV